VESAEISVSLLDDDAMAALNRRWLGRPGSTDVLAFSLAGDGEAPLGDVYVGRERAAHQAVEHGVPLEEELVRLVVHGTLHVLGHDHPEGPERLESEMFRRQEALVGELVSPRSGSAAGPGVEPAGEGGAGPAGRDGAA
jgi:probable rRNA maturation factor